MQLIVIPATETDHLNLALNIAMGIKSNDRQQKTVLLHTVEVPTERVLLFERFFDFLIYEPTSITLSLLKLITHKYLDIFGWSAAIVLDINILPIPGKLASELFGTLQPHDFTCYNNDFYDFNTKTKSRTDYTFHCDLNEAKLHFGLSGIAPQVKSSFLYFKNSDRAKRLFDTAVGVWNSSFFATYKAKQTAEACLNIACSITGTLPHQIQYRPVYWQQVAALKTEDYIYHQYPFLEVDLKEAQSERIVRLYNRLSDYYKLVNGIKEQSHFRSIVPVKEKRKIFGFYHICAMNHYKVVIEEQIAEMVKSGLYDAADAIFVGCVGFRADLVKVQEILYHYPKFKLLSHKGDLKQYEFPTLKLLKTKTSQEKPFFGFYIHTKGVTFPNQPERAGGDHWRGYMGKYILNKWQDNVTALQSGNDLSGATWIAEGDFHRHYRGNFFWFNSDYVKRLPDIESLDTKDRYQAEFWIGKENPMIHSLADLQIDYANQIPYDTPVAANQ